MPLKTAHSEQLIKPSEVADLLGLHPNTVRNWIKRGEVPFVKTPTGQYLLPWSLLTQALRGTYNLEELAPARDLTEEDAEGRLPE